MFGKEGGLRPRYTVTQVVAVLLVTAGIVLVTLTSVRRPTDTAAVRLARHPPLALTEKEKDRRTHIRTTREKPPTDKRAHTHAHTPRPPSTDTGRGTPGGR
jgi:hypothetical protein